MNIILQALKEWRDARQAFFDLPQIGADPKHRVPESIMQRLANAEQRLMDLARNLDN